MSAARSAGHPPLPQAHSRLEPVFRETFLAGFREPVHADILRLIGDFLHTLAVETFYWTGEEHCGHPDLSRSVEAAAEDLGHLAEHLQEIATVPRVVPTSEEDSGLCRKAERWAERLRELILEMSMAVAAGGDGEAGEGG
jgi:hypothetical protein